MNARKALKLIFGIGLASFFLWLVVRQISPAELRQSFASADPGWITLALLAFLAGYACRIERWRLMLVRSNPELGWRHCAGPLLASVAANNVLPFRAGDLIRAFGFNRRLKISANTAIITLFAERLLDLLMVLLFLGLALGHFGADINRLAGIGGLAPMAAAALILAILLFPRVFAAPGRALAQAVMRIAPKLGQKALDEVDKGLNTLELFSTGHTMPRLILWSFLAWLAEGAVFWFAALALPSLSAPLAGWLALPIGTLATLIPSTPGYIGTFDYFTARAMTELGNDAGAATAFALLVHILLWLPPTLIGGIYLLLNPTRTSQEAKAS